MAFKIADGFDHYNTVADFLARSNFLQWQIVSAVTPTVTFVTGLTGFGKALQLTTTTSISGIAYSALRSVFADRNAEAFPGFRVKLPLDGAVHAGLGNSAVGLWLEFLDTVAGAVQFTVHLNENNYSIEVWAGSRLSGTLVYASPNNVWPGNSAFFLEIGAKVNNSSGYVKARVNGVQVASITGIDTQATANAWFDGIDWTVSPVAIQVSSTAVIDDFKYNDTATDPGASANDSFIGDVGARTLFLTGDVSVQWAPNTGANNFSRLNETAMDSDISYTFSANPGDEDRFTAQPLINVTALIVAVQITIAARKDDVGPRVIKDGFKSGATVSYGGNHSVPDTYVYFTDVWVLDPNTTANWIRAAVNALEPLYNLVS